jgi:transcriptional regulator with XRE-family HTH domain
MNKGRTAVSNTLIDRLQGTGEGRRLLQQERTILDLTELICAVMEEQKVSRSDLARLLGKTKGYVTQLLDGRTNMTLRTMSDVFAVLGRELKFRAVPEAEARDIGEVALAATPGCNARRSR